MSLKQLAVLTGHTDRVWHVAWSPCGKYLASCGGDRAIRVWGAPPSQQQQQQQQQDDNDAANAPPTVDAEWRLLATLEDGQTRTVRCCEWSPCGKLLAAVSFDATCVIWELQPSGGRAAGEMEWELAASVEGHEHEAKCVAWNRGGTLLATCSRDKSVWIWECLQDNDFECLSVLHGHEQDVKFVKFHPREDVLFSAGYDDTLKVWQEEDDDWACVATLKGHTSTVWGLSIGSRDDGLVSCSDDGSLIIWKAANGEGNYEKWRIVSKLEGQGNKATVYSVDWSRESGAIAAGGADDSIRVFCEDVEQPQGWALDSPTFVCEARVEKAHEADVNCVRWNPVRPWLLASAGDDQVVRVWEFRRRGE